MHFFVCWLALCCLIFGQQAPQTTPNSADAAQNVPEMTSHDAAPTFSSKVNLVLVPVVVRNREGKAIGTLTKDDFRVFDRNKPQVIARFSVESTAHAVAKAGDGSNAASAAESKATAAEMPERYVAYVFDDLNTSLGDLARVQQAAKRHFAERLQPSDRAAIFSTSGRTNLDFTNDRSKLQDTLMKIHPVAMFAAAPNECPDVSYYMADEIQNKNDQIALQAEIQDTIVCARLDPSSQASKQQAQEMVISAASRMLSVSEQGTRITLGVLKDVVRRMSAMPGQRLVVIVSPGFLTLNPESFEAKTDILDRAARANVVISSLDARGLYTDATFDASQGGAFSVQGHIVKSQYDRQSATAQADVLAELADGTGGTFVQNNNDLFAGLNRVAAAPEYVYLLGFSPENLKSDGSFHKLKVGVVDDKGLSVQARRGYYAPRHTSKPEDVAKNEIEEAVFSREEMHDLPIDLHTQFFKPDPADAKLTILAKVDLKHLRFRKADGRNQNNLTIVSALFDRDGKYVMGQSKTLEMKLKDETLERLTTGITVRTNFDVKPGSYMVRLVIRDTEGQMMAAANGAVDIP
ncbi:MAG: VWA domain-containing protein [Acidobacteriaceae bacterium]|nr:VWA domain-containing protein [Acidobacteriaceae bacterium]